MMTYFLSSRIPFILCKFHAKSMPMTGPAPAFIHEVEAGIEFLRTDSLRHGHPRVWKDLHLLAQTATHFPASPPSPANAAGKVNRATFRASIADRYKEDAHKFLPLNDTTGRPKRVFRKTPPPTKNRRKSAPEIAAAALHLDDIVGYACLNKLVSINDVTGRPKRVFTLPPSRSNASSGQVDSEQAGAEDKHEQPCDAKPPLSEFVVFLCTLCSFSLPEDGWAPRL